MGKYDNDNVAINCSYLFRELTPKITESEYIKGLTIPGFLLGYPSIKAIRSRNLHILDQHKKAIALGFSTFLKDDAMKAEDLDMDPEQFRKRFPPEKLVRNLIPQSEAGHPEFFMNKVFRTYYLVQASPHRAYLGYLKIFAKKGKPEEAYWIRGVQDYDKVERMFLFNFDSPRHLLTCLKDKKREFGNDKGTESIHLYHADKDSIHYSKDCIRIDFTSDEKVPCKASLFWNVSQVNKMEDIRHYIGGSALCVDTNEGLRGKAISAFKVGLEAREDTPLADKVKEPMNLLRPELLAELRRAANEECGMTIIDNADDHKFFTCLRRDDIRTKEFSYSSVDVQRLISELMYLRHEMTIQVDHLKSLREKEEEKAR